jgi:hypothetical protein
MPESEILKKSKIRAKRREQRGLRKRKAGNSLDDLSDDDNIDITKFPTPSQDLRKGGNKGSKVEQKKGTIDINNIPLPDFTDLEPFRKNFWTGPIGVELPDEELKQNRKTLGVLVKGNLLLAPPPITDFNSKGVPTEFSQYFTSVRLTKPVSVQKQGWPIILSGANLLCLSPTGSGKTICYSLPMIPHILAQIKGCIYYIIYTYFKF